MGLVCTRRCIGLYSAPCHNRLCAKSQPKSFLLGVSRNVYGAGRVRSTAMRDKPLVTTGAEANRHAGSPR